MSSVSHIEDAAGNPQTVKRATREFQRVYKACNSCREKKVRCDLGGSNQDIFAFSGPPCARCRRERRKCVFSEERGSSKRQRIETRTNPTDVNDEGAKDKGVAENAIRNKPNSDRDGAISPDHSEMRLMDDASQASRSPCSSGHISNPASVLDVSNAPSSAQRGGVDQLVAGARAMVNSARSESSTPGVQYSLQTPESRMTDSVMRTVVRTGNDPLSILFEAATEHDERLEDGPRSLEELSARLRPREAPTGGNSADPSATLFGGEFSQSTNIVGMSSVDADTLSLWNSSKFVKMGLFTAEQAVTYVDAFFKNLSPLSPILTDDYADHKSHSMLLSREPLLCTTILMISTRYHTFPGIGSQSRSRFAHRELWNYTQRLILRVILGQEKGPENALRSVGSIEALLLMSEWYPHAIQFAPENYGWDSELVVTNEQLNSPSTSWLEDVIEPTKRSDRMSWMLLGSANMLAHELGIFSEEADGPQRGENRKLFRRLRARELLCVYVTLLAARLGCRSMIAISFNKSVLTRLKMPTSRTLGAWIELLKLAKTVSTLLFSSTLGTQELLRSGQYIDLMEHLQPLLTQWRQRYLDNNSETESHNVETNKSVEALLFIEYHSVRMYSNSLAMQAAIERCLTRRDSGFSGVAELPQTSDFNLEDEIEYPFIQEVVCDACEILQQAILLSNANTLRFHPGRTFFRIIGASVFLLKAVMLGVQSSRQPGFLELLEHIIKALKDAAIDDVHLAASYALLLDRYVARLRSLFDSNMAMAGLGTGGHVPIGPHFLANNYNNGSSEYDDSWATLALDPFFSFDITQDLSALNGHGFEF